jgi:Zn-dependent peptidase ImmA (M78 family)
MFTLAHEVAHLWLGASGVSEWRSQAARETERFCNAVAAEVLVPTDAFMAAWSESPDATGLVNRLARQFKTSSLVILIRAKEAGRLSETEFEGLYAQELSRINAGKGGSGGDFYRTQGSRLGKRFARAVTVSTLEGETSYTEALELLGLKNAEHLNRLASSLGVAP